MATYDAEGKSTHEYIIEEQQYPKPDSSSYTGQYITEPEAPPPNPALDPGGTLLGNLPTDLTPEETEAIREARISAYTGPDVEAGTAKLPSSVLETPTAPGATSYMTPEGLVSEQLTKLLTQGSPLMTLAESRAMEEAQQRGLLSSSMAVGAGQKALYDAAFPIASQDAKAYSDLIQEQYKGDLGFMAGAFEGDIQAFLNAEEAKYRLIGSAQEGQIQKELQDDQQAHNQILQQMDQDFRAELISFQESESYRRLIEELASREGIAADEIQAKLEMHQLDIISATAIKNAELANTMAMHVMEMDVTMRANYLDAAGDLASNFNNALAHINGIPDSQISPANKDKYINGYVDANGYHSGLVDRYTEQLNFLASIMGGDFTGFTPATGGGSSGQPVPPMPTDAPAGHAYRFNSSTWSWELYQLQTSTPPPGGGGGGGTQVPGGIGTTDTFSNSTTTWEYYYGSNPPTPTAGMKWPSGYGSPPPAPSGMYWTKTVDQYGDTEWTLGGTPTGGTGTPGGETPPGGSDGTPNIDTATPGDYWVIDAYGNKVKNPDYDPTYGTTPGETPDSGGFQPQPNASTTYPGKVDAPPGSYYDSTGTLKQIPAGYIVENGELVQTGTTGDTTNTWSGTQYVAPAGLKQPGQIGNPAWTNLSPLLTDANSSFYNLTTDAQRTSMTNDLNTLYTKYKAEGGAYGMTSAQLQDRFEDMYWAMGNSNDPTQAYKLYQQLQTEINDYNSWYDGLNLSETPWMTDTYNGKMSGYDTGTVIWANPTQTAKMKQLYGWGQYDNVLQEAMNTGVMQQMHPDAQQIYDDWMQAFGWNPDYAQTMASSVQSGTGSPYTMISKMQHQLENNSATGGSPGSALQFWKTVDQATGQITDPAANTQYKPYSGDTTGGLYFPYEVGTFYGTTQTKPQIPDGYSWVTSPLSGMTGFVLSDKADPVGQYSDVLSASNIYKSLYTYSNGKLTVTTTSNTGNYNPTPPSGYYWKLSSYNSSTNKGTYTLTAGTAPTTTTTTTTTTTAPVYDDWVGP